MLLISTRNAAEQKTPLKAVLKGIAPDGGLYVPENFPELSLEAISQLQHKTYQEMAGLILSKYIDMTQEELTELAQRAYESFDDAQVAPLVKLPKGEFILELFHGPTLAFKDMALQVLPRLMSAALQREEPDKKVLILTATSGDTGKAALEGFKDVPNTAIVVFFPDQGVSDMQKLQMVTQRGNNTFVSAVVGNFDDAQTGVKRIFADQQMEKELAQKGYALSSANSINFGRLAPQIVYYIYSYVRLLERGEISLGEKINFVVPTGNFGNILAAYYAKQMGLPVHKLICASNKNNVLTDFFRKGIYNKNREFYKTISPSMDILISSNLERLLFELFDRDDQKVRELMESLMAKGEYAIGEEERAKLEQVFYGEYCNEQETEKAICDTFAQEGYLLDTHTAVAKAVYDKYLADTNDQTKTVIVSTASPYKFAADVLSAVSGEPSQGDAFAMAQKLEQKTGVAIPANILELRDLPVRHDHVEPKEHLADFVRAVLK